MQQRPAWRLSRSSPGRRRSTRSALARSGYATGPSPCDAASLQDRARVARSWRTRRVPTTASLSPFGSGMAAELGLVTTVGVGSAATRSISWLHCAALRALVVTSGEGAVRPERAECATVAAAAGFSVVVAGGRAELEMNAVPVRRGGVRVRRAGVAHEADDLVGHEFAGQGQQRADREVRDRFRPLVAGDRDAVDRRDVHFIARVPRGQRSRRPCTDAERSAAR